MMSAQTLYIYIIHIWCSQVPPMYETKARRFKKFGRPYGEIFGYGFVPRELGMKSREEISMAL